MKIEEKMHEYHKKAAKKLLSKTTFDCPVCCHVNSVNVVSTTNGLIVFHIFNCKYGCFTEEVTLAKGALTELDAYYKVVDKIRGKRA